MLKKNLKKISTLLNLTIVFLVIVVIMLWTNDVIVYFAKKPQKKPVQTSNVTSAQYDLMNYEVVVKNNPFGIKSEELKPIKSFDSSTEKQADVDYKLIGTIAGSDRYSFAIFASKESNQEIYKVGTSIGNLGKLSKVYPSKVILNKDGQNREIPLAEIVNIEEIKQQTTHSFKGTEIARQTGDRSFVVDQKKIQQAIDNPNQILTDARLLPNFVDGVQKGFVIREIKHGGIYHNLGLRDGDVLLRINDYNINNPESGLQAFTALKGLERVNLDIIRGNSNLTLSYLIR
ncbi:MAG TPA: hypothetical protein HPP56_00950 [Nitrospirae bacterium]|nr:hypothetical protein [Nitrospirota bacterium]